MTNQVIVEAGAQQQTAEQAAAALAEAAKTAPTTEQEARDQIAAKKVEADAGKVERPAWLDEKFQSPEDLAKAYAELSKKLGEQKTEEKPEAELTDAEKAAKAEADKKAAEEAAKKSDEPAKPAEVVSKLQANFDANGKLSDEDYAEAEKLGYDKGFVDRYIEGQKALADRAVASIEEAGGGKEQVQSMMVWASTAVAPADIDTFNAAMNGGDVNAAVTAMAGLKAKYEQAVGIEPKLIGGKQGVGNTAGYASWDDVKLDMAKPEYKTSPAFRSKVENRLRVSNI